MAGTVCELAPEPARHASRMRGGATAPPPPRSGETGPALHMYGPLLFGPSIFFRQEPVGVISLEMLIKHCLLHFIIMQPRHINGHLSFILPTQQMDFALTIRQTIGEP